MSAGLSKLSFYVSRRCLWGNYFFGRIYFFDFPAEHFLTLGRKSDPCCQISILVSRRTFRGEFCFLRKRFFPYSHLERKIFWRLTIFSLQSLSKLHSTRPRTNLLKGCLLNKKNDTIGFGLLGGNDFGLLEEKIPHGCQNSNLRVRRKILKRIVSPMILNFWAKKWDVWRRFFRMVVKCVIDVSRKTISKIFCERNNCASFFTKKLSVSCRNVLARFAKAAFH